jgi:hypothetical protein
MAGRTIPSWLVTLALAVVVAGGCDDTAEQTVPPIHDLGEPWQAVPFVVDPTIVARAERVCRDADVLPDKAEQLVLADARGGNFVFLMFANGFNDGQCSVERQADGVFINQGGGGSFGGNLRAVVPPNGLEFAGSGSESVPRAPGQPNELRSYATGRVGAGIAVVEVVLTDGSSLQATVDNGWFAAWWPTAAEVKVVRGHDRGGSVIATAP